MSLTVLARSADTVRVLVDYETANITVDRVPTPAWVLPLGLVQDHIQGLVRVAGQIFFPLGFR